MVTCLSKWCDDKLLIEASYCSIPYVMDMLYDAEKYMQRKSDLLLRYFVDTLFSTNLKQAGSISEQLFYQLDNRSPHSHKKLFWPTCKKSISNYGPPYYESSHLNDFEESPETTCNKAFVVNKRKKKTIFLLSRRPRK